jgi:hypothetical protein
MNSGAPVGADGVFNHHSQAAGAPDRFGPDWQIRFSVSRVAALPW